jgi:oligoendopeptidase F
MALRSGDMINEPVPESKGDAMKLPTSRSAFLVSSLLAVAALQFATLVQGAAAPDGRASEPQVPTMWDLTDLYSTPEVWNASYTKSQAAAKALDQYKGKLGTNSESLFKALDAISALNKEAQRLYTYASLKGDEDLRSAADQERRQKAQGLVTLLGEQTSWVAPELVALGETRVNTLENGRADLKARFGFFLRDTLRSAPHTLGPEAEQVLAAAGDVLAQPTAIHDQLAHTDMQYPMLTLPGDKRVRLDEPAYEKYRQSDDRAERKQVFDAFWGTWKKYEGTAGAALTTQVMGDVFTAKERHFDSALAASLFQSNMPEAVYRTLVAQANAGLPTLHRYLRLRKARLGIKGDLEYYDNYPSMFELTPAPTFSVADAERITLEALAPMGPEYLGILRHGFAGKWMNVLPHPGKATGAYMNGSAYDVHPYLLLNHNNDYESLSTLAHEWGHAVHTQLTDKSQPFETSNYSTFIAESASIGNEMLLNDYMVAHAASKAEKLYYLGQGLESIRTTFFRQVLFAEFEAAIHAEIEKGSALSGPRLSDMYCGLIKRYYGEAEGVMKIDPKYCLEWAYVPHFYYDFYVWQYATSMAGAAAFTDAILKEGPAARDRFVTMLKAGGSDYPYELYKRAGVDMASPEPYKALVARMNRLMDEIDALDHGQ